jgi:hypothetical protein
MGQRVDAVEHADVAAFLWRRLRWAGCWGLAAGWPDGRRTDFENEYARIDKLDIPPDARVRRLTRWLEDAGDPGAVQRDMRAAVDTVRRYDVAGEPPPPWRRLHAVGHPRRGG